MEDLVDYSRQREMYNVIHMGNRAHVIVGCGGIGFWLGILLAMNGYGNFIVFDSDKLEKTNLNRIPCPPEWAGINKTTALRRILCLLRPDAIVKAHNFKVNEASIELFEACLSRIEVSVIWDTTDNAVDQRKIYNMAVSKGYEYRKIGYEGFKIGSYKEYPVWTAAGYQPGYRTTMANACSSVMAAALGFFSQGIGVRHDVVMNIYNFIECDSVPKETSKKKSTKQEEISQSSVHQEGV